MKNEKFKMKNSVKHSSCRHLAVGAPLSHRSRTWAFVIFHFSFFIYPWLSLAFPPAPDGVIYGLVKDQYGTPLMNTNDRVILQTPGGVQVLATIQPGLAIGVNYALHVPMDAGVLPTPYVANALTAAAPYALYVAVGTTTNLPLEMVGAAPALGKPSQMALQNLTVGMDANGDGIPDAWEQLFLQEIGANLALANLNTNTDYAHDGRTLLQEYLLGNYPYNPSNNFSVNILSQNSGSAILAFTAMTGRSYSAFGSADLSHWTPVSFTVPAAGPAVISTYYSQIIQPVQLQTVQPANAPQFQFFRLQLQ
jgi:hypothetical protein